MMLVRHAQSEWNRHFSETKIDPGIPDPPLTDLGRQQARALAEELGPYELTALIASPYLRALETAEIVASALDLHVSINPLVRERCVFSCDVGSNPDVLRGAYPHIDFSDLGDRWWGVPPESEDAVIERCTRFRSDHGDLLMRRDVAIISHWGFIRAFTGEEVANAAIVHVDHGMSGRSPAP
ncbi:MAG: histidine phosphatase family protein [Alphaproteobacteria bacterium]